MGGLQKKAAGGQEQITVKSLELQHKHARVTYVLAAVQEFLSPGATKEPIFVVTACTQTSNANGAHPLTSSLDNHIKSTVVYGFYDVMKGLSDIPAVITSRS